MIEHVPSPSLVDVPLQELSLCPSQCAGWHGQPEVNGRNGPWTGTSVALFVYILC